MKYVDSRYAAAIKRIMAAQRRGQDALAYCRHERTALGVIISPLTYQLLDVCASPACREILSGPIVETEFTAPLSALDPRELIVVGDTSQNPYQCGWAGCKAVVLEAHHYWPRHVFGADAERGPVGPLCPEHHRYWHQMMDRRRHVA